MKYTIQTLVTLLILLTSITEVKNQAIDYVITDEEIQLQRYDKDLLTEVTVTMYEPVEGQTDDTPDIVADGSRFDIPSASNLKWVAVSRDLHTRWGGDLHFGDVVYIKIEGDQEKTGYYLVKDTMNARWTNRIDILESPGHALYKHPGASLYVVKPKSLTKDELWAHLGP